MTAEQRPPNMEPAQQVVEWPQDWEARLDRSWEKCVLPIAETDSRWEQTTPIPAFFSMRIIGGSPFYQLAYLFTCDKWKKFSGGSTRVEAEAKMRRALPSYIETGRGMTNGVIVTPRSKAQANELGRYFRQKPQTQPNI